MSKRYSDNAPVSQYDPFAEIYDEWSEHMTEDVAFYVDLARETKGPFHPPGWGTAFRRFKRNEKNWTRV